MNFELNQDQQMLKDAARGFLSKECPSTFVRKMAEDEKGCTPEFWNKMAELGWLGLLIPERYGGFDGRFLDLAVLLSEMGYACMPGPFFSTAVVGGITLLEAGSEDQKKAILPAVAQGKQMLTLAWVEKDGTYLPKGVTLRAELKGDRYILSGTKLFVPDAHTADTLICVGRTGESQENEEWGLSLFLVDRKCPGIKLHQLNTIGGDKQFEISFEKVNIPQENLLGEVNKGWSTLKGVLQKAAVAKCAEADGGAKRVIEFVVPHTKERVQFGKPIGTFQAVQHHCANILTLLETSKFLTYQAAWRISQGLDYEKEASMCKAWVSDAYSRLVALAHQVMGGVAFMEEHDLHLYFNRAKATELAFGDSRYHRELVAQKLGL